MSRCFPFPPPGYEKKAGPDDENLLEKEKRKQKKHKEKKDKNKKDRKEKKDREGKRKDKDSSKDKRREIEDRKERHKHKKDKNKKNEKQRPSEDKITEGPPECSTVDNPGSGCTQSDETSDIKYLVELGKRIRDNDKTTENVTVKKINLTHKICSKYPEKVGESKNGNSDGKAMLTEKGTSDRKFCGHSNNTDARGTENGTVQNFVVGQQRKVEGMASLVDKNIETKMLPNKIDEHTSSKSRGDTSNERDRDGERKLSTERKSKKELNKEQLLIARERSRQAGCKDSNTGSSPLPNESKKNSNLGKRKELRINGFLHDDELRPSKLQRPLTGQQKSLPELVAMVNNHKLDSKLPSAHQRTEDRSKFKATLSDSQYASVRQKTGDIHKVNNSVSSSNSTLEDARTSEKLEAGSLSASECYRSSINYMMGDKVGLCHPILENRVVHKDATLTAAGEHEAAGHSMVDNKVDSHIQLSHFTLENGRTSDSVKAGSQSATECYRSSIKHKMDDKVGLAHPVLENGIAHKAATFTAARGHEAVGHLKVHNKEHKIDGLVDDKRPNGFSTRPSASTVKQTVVEHPKPPHPDSKYLTKILAIPSIERSDFGGQDWLLGSNSKHTKSKPSSSQFEEMNQVWDKALQLESANVTALPYVIPY